MDIEGEEFRERGIGNRWRGRLKHGYTGCCYTHEIYSESRI